MRSESLRTLHAIVHLPKHNVSPYLYDARSTVINGKLSARRGTAPLILSAGTMKS